MDIELLSLEYNNIEKIERGVFNNLDYLEKLDLRGNRIKNSEDGAFLFLPSITGITLKGNKDLMCGCHLPALVKYMRNNYNRTVNVSGECQTDLGKRIPIPKYSQCTNYSLFQRNLQCQTCSGMMCNHSGVTNCPGAEPVCRLTLSMNGVTLRFERSCSTRRKCVEAMRNNSHRCKKWTDGTSCTGCCVGNLCNKNDIIRSCNEDTTSNNGIFHWPVTKIGSSVTIPCHANVATRLCSSRTVKHPEMASNQSRTSLKCSPFTGIWQEPDMSQCYNTEGITRRLKDIRSQDIDQRNIANISKEVLNVSQKSVYFKQQDIDLAVDILEKMCH
ncbi:uncharacterized protein LOC118768405 [Octopus sinensis]|uniref:Uncharacterized protein LOC118768405 n=1 Tax=Octopus sinensis TaxID=2607531 RepID=A0A7E6FSZ2_9MOLL|nr:uncharacterized protein LOC118768405 [Octopus sinensis]